MQYLLLITVTVLISLGNVLQKQYNIKTKNPNIFLYSGLTSFFAMLFFIITSQLKLTFVSDFLPYSMVFGISYAMSLIGKVYAIRVGSLAISSLIISYSLLVPTAYGVVFLNDDIKVSAYIGIFLLIISMFMLNAEKGEFKFSFKWLIYILLAFIGNGLCSTVQKMEQLAFDGMYKNEFMIIALGISTFVLLVTAFFQKGDVKEEIKRCFNLSVLGGFSNGVVNLFVILLTGSIPNSVLFPSISAGGIALSFFVAMFVYKEKLLRVQITGYILGIASVILLNL